MNSDSASPSSCPSASPKSRWFRIAAIASGLLAGLFLGALFLMLRAWLFPSTQWIYLYEPGHEKTGHRYIYDKTYGWRNIPNWRGTTFGQPLTINSKGLRDSEHSYAKPAGSQRILILGDSYTWGYGVGDDEVYTEVLERKLRTQGSWQVLNAGVSGWGTDQQYLYLREEGFRYNPDIVIVSFFFGNDFREISASQQYQLDKPVFLNTSLTLANVPVPKPRKASANPVVYSQSPSDQLADAIFRRLSSDCRNRGVKLIVFKFGTYLDPATLKALHGDMPEPKRQGILEMMRHSDLFSENMRRIPGLHYFDIDRVFATRGFSFEELGVIASRDMHWNAFGHKQVAENLYSFLLKDGHLTPR